MLRPSGKPKSDLERDELRLTTTPLRLYDRRHAKDKEQTGEADINAHKKTGGTTTEKGIEG